MSTNTFYYWAKRLRTAPAAAQTDRSIPPRSASRTPSLSSNPREAMVRFRGKTGMEVSVPAHCLDAIRCLAECLAQADDHRGEAFQEVVVKA